MIRSHELRTTPKLVLAMTQAIVACLILCEPPAAFAQFSVYSRSSAIREWEAGVIDEDEFELDFPPQFVPEDLKAQTSASVTDASSSAYADRNIVRASATASRSTYQGVTVKSEGITEARFSDTIKIHSLNGPVTGENFALSGMVRWTRTGFGPGLFGDVQWAFFQPGQPGIFEIDNAGQGGGEKLLTIPLGSNNPEAKLSIWWSAEASASAGHEQESGDTVSTSIELVQDQGFLGFGGGDAFVLGTASGPDTDLEFTANTETFGIAARVIGNSGRVYKRGDKNVILIEQGKQNFLDDLKDWLSGGAGTASTVQNDSSGSFEQLETGSEVFIYQLVDTPEIPMNFFYDVALLPNSEMENLGTLNVYLNSILIDTVDSSELGLGQFFERNLFLSDPALLGLTDAELKFHWDGPTGEIVWLDNAVLTPVPEPATYLLVLVSLLFYCGRRIAVSPRRGGRLA